VQFDPVQARLLVHCLNLNYLSQGYFENPERRAALIALMGRTPPLFARETVTNKAKTASGTIFRLTREGVAVATELKRVLTTSTR
jgi:hypothetical protein